MLVRAERESNMATYASKLRDTGVDGSTITLDEAGCIRSGLEMEPFNAKGHPSVFYVDGNRSNQGDGKTWATAFNSLAYGLAAAHSYMSTSSNRAWAHRAKVYVCGDALTEDLTKFAEKTDVIGVGSCNQHPRVRIDGTHVLEAATSDTYHGCRFFNIEFYGAAAGIIVDIPANQNGICFYNCVFSSTDAATIGLRQTQSHDMKIVNCCFDPNTSGTGFSTAAIQVNAGVLTNFELRDCRIYSGAIGVDFNCTTGQAINCWAIDNLIYSTGIGIDSEDDTLGLLVVGNRMITATDTTTYTAGFDFPLRRSLGNIITGQDETDMVPNVISGAAANSA